jgi:hypothetical protein
LRLKRNGECFGRSRIFNGILLFEEKSPNGEKYAKKKKKKMNAVGVSKLKKAHK